MKDEKANIVYHYCTLQGFLGIIQNASLWVSDISKSNDGLECIYGRNQIKNRIEKEIENNAEAMDEWRMGYEMNADLHNSKLTYVACFTEKKDCLSQWRGYADDGRGMALGFDKKVLEQLSKSMKFNLEFAKVIYNETEQETNVDRLVKEILKIVEEKGAGIAGLELNSNFKMEFPFYKHPGFEEEEEWRLVLTAHPFGREMKVGNMKFSEPKYRVSNGKLISYRELCFSDIKEDFVKEIWIGSKADVELRDIMQVLKRYHYYENAQNGYNLQEPILVMKSSCSYR